MRREFFSGHEQRRQGLPPCCGGEEKHKRETNVQEGGGERDSCGEKDRGKGVGGSISTMKFVALVSGGKDSCYNSMECVRHGHELVCLANLYPPAAVSDEADSFMYQSAAHTAIEAQAECFGKPLIRRELAGRAVNQSLQYRPTEDDEVEDLFLLLKEVKERFPEVQGVGSGAILSNYQRTRVENVCGRLGLQSLAYLWRRPQSPLLAEMVESGLDAVLVKVASFGLEPSKHLGRSLARLRPFFESLHSRCGFHVCGEGGEYETLTLDCPLFVRRLVLDETVVVNHSDDMFAPVGLLRVVKCHTEAKAPPIITTSSDIDHNGGAAASSGAASPSVDGGGDVKSGHELGGTGGPVNLLAPASTPEALSGTDCDCHTSPSTVGKGAAAAAPMDAPPSAAAPAAPASAAAVSDSPGGIRKGDQDKIAASPTFPLSPTPSRSSSSLPTCCLHHVHEGSGGLVYVSGVSGGSSGERRGAGAAAEQAAECLARVRAGLEVVGVSFRDVCFVHLYLRDMGHFSSVNEEYCKWFQGENPPSRSCVSVPLPAGCSVMLDVVALRGSGDALAKEGAACAHRQVLHVRSISSWAPVCIGPYCQANTLGPGGGIALIAGQIGLQPECMTFPPRTPLPAPVPASACLASASNVAPPPIHERELSLCVSHASSVASAVGASVSRGCVFATLYVSQEAAIAAAAGGSERMGGTQRIRGSAGGGEAQGAGSSNTIGLGWLQGMIDDCRVLMEARCAQEQAEAAAEAAGTGAAGGGDDDSAEDGWTSDPEELAKEAAKKLVLVRRVPILAVVVRSLPKNATVELEVLCMSRAALSILPCRHYPPTSRIETFSASPFTTSEGRAHPVPARFIPPPSASSIMSAPSSSTYPDPQAPTIVSQRESNASNGGDARGAEEGVRGGDAAWTARVTTTGSTVDRILGVCASSLSIAFERDGSADAAASAAAAAASATPADESTPSVANSAATAAGNTTTTDDTDAAAAADAAALETEAAVKSPASSHTDSAAHIALSGALLERAMSLVLSGVSDAVSAARLRWRDVSSLRVYYRCALPRASTPDGRVSPGPPGGGEQADVVGGGGDGGGMDEELLKRATFLAMAAATRERPAVTFVPVAELEQGAVVSVHATAWSLSRLRTELWVRGAA